MDGKPGLLIDPALGMAGDMFSAALLSLGVPTGVMTAAMERAACRLGQVSIEEERIPIGGATAVKLYILLEPHQPHLPAGEAWDYLEEAIAAVCLQGSYDSFARRALDILVDAERQVHSTGRLPLSPVKTEGSDSDAVDHQEMHRLGMAHRHQAEESELHEAQDILIDVIGAAIGLQCLNVDLNRVVCLNPVRVGGGFVTFSHGRLAVPAPATRVILNRHSVPCAAGPVEKELLTPTGASLLTALRPEFRLRGGVTPRPFKIGIGRGLRRMEPPGDLLLGLWREEAR